MDKAEAHKQAHRMHEIINAGDCPTCGAKQGTQCKNDEGWLTPNCHPERAALVGA